MPRVSRCREWGVSGVGARRDWSGDCLGECRRGARPWSVAAARLHRRPMLPPRFAGSSSRPLRRVWGGRERGAKTRPLPGPGAGNAGGFRGRDAEWRGRVCRECPPHMGRVGDCRSGAGVSPIRLPSVRRSPLAMPQSDGTSAEPPLFNRLPTPCGSGSPPISPSFDASYPDSFATLSHSISASTAG